MKTSRIALGLVLASAIASHAHGQVSNPSVQYVAVAPSGACSASPPVQVVISTGVMYTCNNGTWAAVSGGGGGTTVNVSNANSLGCQVLAVSQGASGESTEYQCDNFTFWVSPNSVSTTGYGALSIVNDIGPINFGACTSDYAVDSVNGSDSNLGTCASPFQTLTKMNTVTLTANKSIGLAANSHWRTDGLMPTANVTGLTIQAYGSGTRPHIDGTVVLSNGSFVLNGGDTYTYHITQSIDGFLVGTVGARENGNRMALESSIANTEANPGSYYYDPTVCKVVPGPTACVFYIHPFNSTNPISDGNTYEVSAHNAGISSSGGSGWNISGLWFDWPIDASVYIPDVPGTTYRDNLIRGGSTHAIYTSENDILINDFYEDGYDNSLGSGGGGPLPIINFFQPNGGMLQFYGQVIAQPATPVANNGGCEAAYAHTPSGTNPTPSVYNLMQNIKMFNCVLGWEDTTANSAYYYGIESYGQVESVVATFAPFVSIQGAKAPQMLNGQIVDLSATSGSAVLSGINGAAVAGQSPAAVNIGYPPFGSLSITDSFFNGEMLADTGAAISSLTMLRNTTNAAFNLQNAASSFTEDYMTWLGGSPYAVVNGSAIQGYAAWVAAFPSQGTHDGPRYVPDVNWGVGANVTAVQFGSGDTFGKFTLNSGGTPVSGATITYTFSVPYQVPPQIITSCTELALVLCYPADMSSTKTVGVATNTAITWTTTGTLFGSNNADLTYTVIKAPGDTTH